MLTNVKRIEYYHKSAKNIKSIKSALKAKSVSEVHSILLAGGAEVGQWDDLDPDHGGLQGCRQQAGGGRGRAQGWPAWSVHSLTGQCDLVKDGDRVFMIRKMYSQLWHWFTLWIVLFHSKNVVASCNISTFDINLFHKTFHMSLTLRIWH